LDVLARIRLVACWSSLCAMSASTASAELAALDTSQVKNLGLVTIAAVLLVGLVIAYLVTKLVTRIIVLIVVVVLGFGLQSQRAKVLDAASKAAKRCDATFFGVHVQPSDDNVKRACAEIEKLRNK